MAEKEYGPDMDFASAMVNVMMTLSVETAVPIFCICSPLSTTLAVKEAGQYVQY